MAVELDADDDVSHLGAEGAWLAALTTGVGDLPALASEPALLGQPLAQQPG